MATVLKTVSSYDDVGSNPSPSAVYEPDIGLPGLIVAQVFAGSIPVIHLTAILLIPLV